MYRLLLFAVGMNVIAIGCTSISSTLLNRTDNDVYVGNSNGEPDIHCGARPFKGVPITLRVPTHLDVAIKEKIYLRKVGGNLIRVRTKHRNLYVEPTIVETDKVFTVDPKRPVAGSLASTITWGTNSPMTGKDNSQYFASIVNNIKDETILDATAALNTVWPTFNKLKGTRTASNRTTPTGSASLEFQLIVESRTLAWKRFDLDSCEFEQEVADFVSQHMNCRQPCETDQQPDAFPSDSVEVEVTEGAHDTGDRADAAETDDASERGVLTYSGATIRTGPGCPGARLRTPHF